MHILLWLSAFVFAQSSVTAPVAKAFSDGVGKYVSILKELEGSVPPQQPTNESSQIADRQQQLTGLVANGRPDPRQGEIFTPEVAEEFRQIIRKAFQEPGGAAMRKTILESDPAKPVALKVNEAYPDDHLRTTMPPTLLSRFPVLPKELAYRIVGRALVLQGTKTNLIVDFIPNAIP
jgi:hypothetical protein